MGQMTMNLPAANSQVTVSWNDVNLRIGDVAWVINSATNIRVRIYRINISPDPIVDEIHYGPETGASTVPGNLRMQAVTDPLYPEEGTRIIWPEGLAFGFEVVR